MGSFFSPYIFRHALYVLSFFTISACGNGPQQAPVTNFEAKSAVSDTSNAAPRLFSPSAILDYSFLDSKDAVRRKIMSRAEFRSYEDAGFPGNEDPALLVDNPENLVINLTKMEELKLRQAELTSKPWSDYYWPTYRGMLGNRYADRRFPESENWSSYYKYVQEFPATNIVRNHGANPPPQPIPPNAIPNASAEIDNLSPSEKYDLITGNANFTLTQKMWNAGKYFWDANKKVETWFGLCHGWAAASYMSLRPAKSIRVYSPVTKSNILLRPSDIKGMLALQWGSGDFKTRFLGGRCEDKNPRRDENGRIISSDCFDMNPGAWHVAIVNQLGIQKRSLILDASYDYEVWNQPVFRYKYEYFDPNAGLLNGRTGSDIEKATIKTEDFTKDRFKKYRDSRTKYVVGVEMEVAYSTEVSPSTSETNGPQQDSSMTVRYRYDLELDENKNIIGGEWYENKHPDFLWTPAPGTRAVSSLDEALQGTWDGASEMPAPWQEQAKKASNSGQALARIVDELVKRAQ